MSKFAAFSARTLSESSRKSVVEVLRNSAVVWDNHVCLPLRADESFLPQLERYRLAGVNVLSVNIGFAEMSWVEHVRILSFMRRWIALRPANFRLVSSVEEIYRCKADGVLGIVFDIEGMYPIQNDISLVQTFYELGVRWLLVAYNRANAAGGGCLEQDFGLTAVGRAIIDEMERVGMVLCLSHTGAQTAKEAMEYSRNPMIFSHSNPSGDTAHARNVTDDLIRSVARRGGVFGLSGCAPLLGSNTRLVESLLRQLHYVIDLVGPEHVGLGLDYVFDRDELRTYLHEKPLLFPPEIYGAGMGFVEPESIAEIAEGLARNNLGDAQIRGILGENWLRIAKQVWR